MCRKANVCVLRMAMAKMVTETWPRAKDRPVDPLDLAQICQEGPAFDAVVQVLDPVNPDPKAKVM